LNYGHADERAEGKKETDMATLKDGTGLYDVERRVRYAERPGFRIT